MSIRCFKCDKELEEEDRGRDDRPGHDPRVIGVVYDGSIFRCYGNFGSTKFDPAPHDEEDFLQIVICDECTEGLEPTLKSKEHLEIEREHQRKMLKKVAEFLRE